MLKGRSNSIANILLSIVGAALVCSLPYLAAREPPDPCDINLDGQIIGKVTSRSQYASPSESYEGYFSLSGAIPSKGDALYVEEYIVFLPQPDVDDLIPLDGAIYRVSHKPMEAAESATFPNGTYIPLEGIRSERLPDGVRRARCTFAIPLNAIASVQLSRYFFHAPPQVFTQIKLVKISHDAHLPTSSATAKVEYWTNGEGDDSHHTKTLTTCDKLQAGRWTFKVTNIVPPQDLPAKGSFEGGHVVGWVEFLLIDVDEERGKAGAEK